MKDFPGFRSTLRKARMEKQLTPKQLGEMTGIDSGYLFRLENRKLEWEELPPDREQSLKLAEALGLDPEDFAKESEAARAWMIESYRRCGEDVEGLG